MTLVNPDSIKTILTLRYSHSLNSDLANLTWKDFNQKHTETSSSHVANLIQNTFEKNENLLKNKPVISLSAGIDSTLILTLLRKNYPDLPLESISISFPNSVDESEKAQKIAEKLSLRFVPDLTFSFDNTFEYANKIEKILKEPKVLKDL